jgi:transposase
VATRKIVLHWSRAARRGVERQSRKTQDKTTFRRCQIVLKRARGGGRKQIASEQSCDVATVSRRLAAFGEQGESGLIRKVSPGRPRKLRDEQMKRLDEMVGQEPREMGKSHSNWSSKTLTKQQGLSVHPVTVQRALKRLGWGWRRPRHRIASPDPRYTPKRRYLRKLERRARRGEIWLYYADEVDIDLLPSLWGRWMRIGHQHAVDTPGKNQKTYGFGAVNVVTGSLAWLLWPHKTNLGFRHLLRQVLSLHPADALKIVVVVDNYRIHKTKAVGQLISSLKGRLRLYFLPTYSPTLNPIERLWRYFREQVTSNYFFKTMARLLVAVDAFFTDLVATPDLVLSLVGVA